MQLRSNGLNFSWLNLGVHRHKFGSSTFAIVLITGIILLVVSQAVLRAGAVNKNWKTISGTITTTSQTVSNGTNLYAAVVLYTIGNKFYTVTSSTSSSSLPKIGASKEVAYNPQSPSQAKVLTGSGAKGLFYFMSLLGVVMIILGPLLYLKARRRTGTIANLRQTGQKRQGIIVDIQSFGLANGYNPEFNKGNATGMNNQATMNYKIVVAAVDGSGATRSYISDAISGIGGLAMVDFHTNAIPIDVYIDPYNPQNYYVDVAEVPTLTPERITQLIQSISHQQPLPQPAISNNTVLPTSPQEVAALSPVAQPAAPQMSVFQQVPPVPAYTTPPVPIVQPGPVVTTVPQPSVLPSPVTVPPALNMVSTMQNAFPTVVVEQPPVVPASSYLSVRQPLAVPSPTTVLAPPQVPIAPQVAMPTYPLQPQPLVQPNPMVVAAALAQPAVMSAPVSAVAPVSVIPAPQYSVATPTSIAQQPVIRGGSYAVVGQQPVVVSSPVAIPAARDVPTAQQNNLSPVYQIQRQPVAQDSNATNATVDPRVITVPNTMTMPTVTNIPPVPQNVSPANPLQQLQQEPFHVPDATSAPLPPIAQQQ